MKTAVLALGCLALLLSGCCAVNAGVLRGSGEMASELRDVSGFDAVDVCCGMNLEIRQGDREALEIEAEANLLPHIETRVRGGRLAIRWEQITLRSIRPTRPIVCRVTMQEIRGIASSGGGDVRAEGIRSDRLVADMSGGGRFLARELELDRLNLDVSGGGEASLGQVRGGYVAAQLSGGGYLNIPLLTADQFVLDLSGGSRANVSGRVNSQRARISGGGSYTAGDLESREMELNMSGGGDGEIWVTESLIADLSGGAIVRYRGKPSIRQDLSGGSRLVPIE